MSLIDMINEEIYEWEITTLLRYVSIEEYRRLRDFRSLNDQYEQNAIEQWLYYDEKDYHNWVYNLDQITEDQKDD